jgi:cytochrome c biogenesis protein CcdA
MRWLPEAALTSVCNVRMISISDSLNGGRPLRRWDSELTTAAAIELREGSMRRTAMILVAVLVILFSGAMTYALFFTTIVQDPKLIFATVGIIFLIVAALMTLALATKRNRRTAIRLTARPVGSLQPPPGCRSQLGRRWFQAQQT